MLLGFTSSVFLAGLSFSSLSYSYDHFKCYDSIADDGEFIGGWTGWYSPHCYLDQYENSAPNLEQWPSYEPGGFDCRDLIISGTNLSFFQSPPPITFPALAMPKLRFGFF